MSPLLKIASAAALFTIALSNPVSAGIVSWSLIEDSMCRFPTCYPPPPGASLAGLTFDDFVPGIGGAISYNYFVNPPGNTDFSLHIGVISPEFPILSPFPGMSTANTDLFFDGEGNINGGINYDDYYSNFHASDAANQFSGRIASDAFGPGSLCPAGACDFTGHWVLTSALPVPEPSGIALLGTAIGLFAFLGLSRGRKRVYG